MGTSASVISGNNATPSIHEFAKTFVDEGLSIMVEKRVPGCGKTNRASDYHQQPKNAVPSIRPVIQPIVAPTMPIRSLGLQLQLKIDLDPPPRTVPLTTKVAEKKPLFSGSIDPITQHGPGMSSGLKSVKSLRSFALQHRNKQDHHYTLQDPIAQNSRVLTRKETAGSNGGGGGGNHHGSGGGLGAWQSMSSTKSSDNSLLDMDFDMTYDRNLGGGGGGGSGSKKKPNIKLNVTPQVDDDADWIQVSDDESTVANEEEDSLKMMRKKLNIHSSAVAAESYLFTQSGK